MKIKISGFAMANADVRTLGDLREFVKWLDRHDVPDCREVDAGEMVFVTLHDSAEGDPTVEFIECGNHIPPDKKFDIILNTHTHDEVEDIPRFDWVTRDRYNDPGRPE